MIETQPKPDSKKYKELIDDIEKGVIKIPKFQREFVWSLDETASLLDSILKAYPIGTFILWQTHERLNDIKNLGNLELPPAPANTKIEYVLDGQQRITSLFAAYRGAEIQKEGEKKVTDYKDIYVNLSDLEDEGEAIVSSEKSEKCLPLYEILNAKFGEEHKFRDEGFTNDEIEKIGEYQTAFHTYDFSVILLKKDDIDTAIEVFTRINTGGQTLTLFEIMAAKTYDEEQKFDMQAKWNEFVNELERVEYETISRTIILHLLALHLSQTKECKRKTVLTLDKNQIIDAWDDVISALKEAIHFFKKSYGIPASKLLPYDSLLVSFAYFFLKKGDEPDGEQCRFLEDFFWRMALSYRYSSSTESKLAQDIRRIDSILNGERPEYKDIHPYLEDPETLIETFFSAGSSYCKAVMCLLAAKQPRDFHNGAKVTLDNDWLKAAHSKNYHHFYPKSYLSKTGRQNENSLMNITLVSDQLNKRKIKAKSPQDYLSAFKKDNRYFAKTMKTHFIDADQSWLPDDDYEAFLSHRAKKIFRALKAKMLEGN